MRHPKGAAAGTIAGLLLLAGCTDGTNATGATEPTGAVPSQTSPSTSVSGTAVDPSVSGTPSDKSSDSSTTDAQLIMDQALDALFSQDSVGFTSDSTATMNGETTSVSSAGAWTRKPLAWTTTMVIDRPQSPSPTWFDGDMTLELVYVQSTPRLVYSRYTPKGRKPWDWVPPPGYAVGPDITRKDVTTPPEVRILTQVTASGATASGQGVVISGTVPTQSALDQFSLTDHVNGLGFGQRLSKSATRVLVTIGADGLPASLEVSGAGIGVAGLDLPDYLLEDFATARLLTEYGDADLRRPIKKPDTTP